MAMICQDLFDVAQVRGVTGPLHIPDFGFRGIGTYETQRARATGREAISPQPL